MGFRWKFNLPTAFVILAVLGCSQEDEDRKGSGGEAASGDRESARSENVKRERHKLDEISGKIDEALDARDWPRARRLIASGLERVAKAGSELEPERGDLLLQRGNLSRDMGDEIAARRDYADSMAIFRVHKLDVGRFRVNLAQAQLEEILGAYAAASRQLDEAEALLEKVDDQSLKGAFLMRSGKLAYRQVQLEKAYTELLDAYKIFADLKDGKSKAEVLLQIAFVEDAQGEGKQCKRSLEKALKVFRELKDRDGEVRALHKLAALAARDGHYRRARSLLKDVKELYEELGRSSDAMKVEQRINALPEGGKKK